MKNFKFYWEENEKSEMRISVPGFLKSEISVKLTATSLRVSAEKRHGKVEKGKGFVREESFSRAFNKFISLPHRIKPDDFEVSITDGEVVMKRKKKVVKEKD